jgi:hypothetical protein
VQVLKAIEAPYSQMRQTTDEQFYLNATTNKKEKFPSILSVPTLYLSVIVPSYNEEKRRIALI